MPAIWLMEMPGLSCGAGRGAASCPSLCEFRRELPLAGRADGAVWGGIGRALAGRDLRKREGRQGVCERVLNMHVHRRG